MGADDLFCGNNRRLIEQKIIKFIMQLGKSGLSSNGILCYLAPVKSFYAINDVSLNVKKIGKFLPENIHARQDRAYSHEEIGKMLEIADERMRAVVLILASSGIQVGALPLLKFSNLRDNQIVGIYEKSSEEYYTFIAPECKKALDFYLDMRSLYGEKLRDESPLIREQFDIRNPGKPKIFNKQAIQYKIYDLCRRGGIDKKSILALHGFRKFFTTQLVKSNVNPEIRAMLLGHKIGLASSYYKPTSNEMLSKYEKAIGNLTIDPANRLQRKVETLTIEKSRLDILEAKYQQLEQRTRRSRN